jgi:hypothetical protein
MSSSLVLSGPRASAMVDRRWIALRRRRTSSCYKQLFSISVRLSLTTPYLKLIDQHRDRVELVVLVLTLHSDIESCRICCVRESCECVAVARER